LRPRTRGGVDPDDRDPVISVYGSLDNRRPTSAFRKRRLMTVRRADGTVDILTVEDDEDEVDGANLHFPALMSKGIVDGQKWLLQGLGIYDPEMQKTISEVLLDTPGGYNNLSREEKLLLSTVLGWGEEDGTKTKSLLLALQFQRLSAALKALGAPLLSDTEEARLDGGMLDLEAIESRYKNLDMQEEDEIDEAALRQFIEESEGKKGSLINQPRWIQPLSPARKAVASKSKASPTRNARVAADVERAALNDMQEQEFQQARVGPGKTRVMPEWWQSAGHASSINKQTTSSGPAKLNPYAGPMGLYGESASFKAEASGSICQDGLMPGLQGQGSEGRRLMFLDEAAADKGQSKHDLMNRIAVIHR